MTDVCGINTHHTQISDKNPDEANLKFVKNIHTRDVLLFPGWPIPRAWTSGPCI